MLDFHTHVLPCIDDGSQSIEESLLMLQALKSQGCEVVAATSHYIADKETPASFFEKRQDAYDRMKSAIENIDLSLPKVCLGAEVFYYSGISRMSELSSFCLENSKLLLLEMPPVKWSDDLVRELIEMNCSSGVNVVLAHFERYLDMQNKDVWRQLLGNGVMLQSNASFFLNTRTRRKALKMLKSGQIHFLGSDCHNMKYRPPMIGDAMSVISDKLGEEFVYEWKVFQRSFFLT